MPESENFYETWGPASRLNPGIARRIGVCTRVNSARPSCRINCLDCQTHLIQDTGSDMLAEDDIASIFGRNAIEKSVDTAFRIFVCRPGTQYTHSPGIFLRMGRGPTLERALAANEPSMFATVLQCAFLCSVCVHSLRVFQTFWSFCSHYRAHRTH